MSRNTRDRGRTHMGTGDYGGGGRRSYGNERSGAYGGPGLMDSGLMGPGGGYGMGGGGGYELDSLLHQRSLQQQLNLRESQLALANSLLQQQQQQQSYLMEGPGMGMRGPQGMGPGMGGSSGVMKRRQEMRQGDYIPEFKRPRNDFGTRPRDRYRGRDSDDGNRSSNFRRNQSSSSSHSASRSPAGRSNKGSGDKYDPEKPTADDERDGGDGQKGKNDQFHCHVCNIDCPHEEGFRRHMSSGRHKERMMGILAIHEEKSSQIASRMKAEKHLRHLEDEDKASRSYCKICDLSPPQTYAEHHRTIFHKKRVLQVTKGCGWCGVQSFKNFTDVLAHRETEEHKKNQEANEGKEKEKKKMGVRRDSGRSRTKPSSSSPSSSQPTRSRSPIIVKLPAELSEFDKGTAYGQMCVIPVSGWFCKLCNKFYNNENTAKEVHCKDQAHYLKYRKLILNRLREKALAEREAVEAAEQRKTEGDSMNTENGGQDKDQSGTEGGKTEEDSMTTENGGQDKDQSGTEEGKTGEDGMTTENGGQDKDQSGTEAPAEEADEGDETGRVEEAMEDDGEGEDDIEEGREGEEEDLMLAPGDTSHEFVEELEDDAVEESLLSEQQDNSACDYQTAEDNTLGEEGSFDTTADQDTSAVSQVSTDVEVKEEPHTVKEEPQEEENFEGDADAEQAEDLQVETPKPRATRATVSARPRGRGRGAAGRARRGRK